jgi:hypothetical protein
MPYIAASDYERCTASHSEAFCGSGGFMGVGDFVAQNYGTIAQVAAGVGCLAAGGFVCGGLLIGGLITDTVQNVTSANPSAGRELLDVVGAIPAGEAAGLEVLADRGGSLARAIGDAKDLAPVRRLGTAVGFGTEGAKKAIGR